MMGIFFFFLRFSNFIICYPRCALRYSKPDLFRNERLVLAAGLLPEESLQLSSLSEGNQNTYPGACLLPGRTGSGQQHPMPDGEEGEVRILDFPAVAWIQYMTGELRSSQPCGQK